MSEPVGRGEPVRRPLPAALERIDRPREGARRRASRCWRQLHLQLDVERPLGSYPVAVQQMVAIARALGVSARVLILDEPTSSLDQQEVRELFAVMHRLRERGMAILFVTHFLDQVYAVSDRITVLRNGALVGEYVTAELTPAGLVTAMVGRELALGRRVSAAADVADGGAPPVVEARGLGRRGALHPVDSMSGPARCWGSAACSVPDARSWRACCSASTAPTAGRCGWQAQRIDLRHPADAVAQRVRAVPGRTQDRRHHCGPFGAREHRAGTAGARRLVARVPRDRQQALGTRVRPACSASR